MSPFRPLTDFLVARLAATGESEVTPRSKAALAGVPSLDLATRLGTTPVATCVERMVLSVAIAFETGRPKLDLPEPALPSELPEPLR